MNLKHEISEKAREAGFDAIGFARPKILENEKEYLLKYLSEGRQASMDYLKKNQDKLLNPFLVMPEVKTIIVCLLNYKPAIWQNKSCRFKVSSYAYGNDYHIVLKKKLNFLADFIYNTNHQAKIKLFTDSGVLLEKAWAIQAGLGQRGKNSLVLHHKLGSMFFIGILMTNIDIEPDKYENIDFCKNCHKCIESCPTAALEPYRIDPRKCISYHTIENKDNLPENFDSKGWIYGCDICQQVCPWNQKSDSSAEKEFTIYPFIREAGNEEWINLDQQGFEQLFQHSSIKRLKYQRLKRNIHHVLKYTALNR